MSKEAVQPLNEKEEAIKEIMRSISISSTHYNIAKMLEEFWEKAAGSILPQQKPEEKPKFSEWVNRQKDPFRMAGDFYDALPENSKKVIDYAVQNYISELNPIIIKYGK